MRKLLVAVIAILLAGSAAAHHDEKPKDLLIILPWARATAGAATTGAVYVKIENNGDHDDRLLAASSPAAAKTELQTHLVENGVGKMRRVDAVDVVAQATTELKPGGSHIMLLGLRQPLREHDTFPLTLTFEHAGSVEVEIHVEEAGASEPTD